MHILWLVRTTLPQAAAACGLAGASDVSGSWLTGQLAALRACPDLQLTVLCVGKEDADGTADGVHYRVVRDTAAFAPLLQAERTYKPPPRILQAEGELIASGAGVCGGRS